MKIQFKQTQTETNVYELNEEDTQKVIKKAEEICVERRIDKEQDFCFWEKAIEELLELDNIIPLLIRSHCDEDIEESWVSGDEV